MLGSTLLLRHKNIRNAIYVTKISGLSIHHYDNVEKLNEFAEQLEQLEEHELLILHAHVQEYGIDEVLRDFDSVNFDDAIIYHDVNSMEDVAYKWYEESGQLAELEKHINVNYIDFEAIGRDMEIQGTFVFLHDYDVCVQLF